MITFLVMPAAPSLFAQTDTEVVLPVTINEVSQGETPVIISGDDVYVPVSTLERAGVTGISWSRVQNVARLRNAERSIAGASAVSLKSLAPWTTFDLDQENLILSIVIDPALIGATAVTIANARPPDIVYTQDNSTFLNYAVTTAGFDEVNAFTEIGSSIQGNLLYTSLSASEDGGVLRGLTNYTIDQRDKLRRLTFGDAPVFGDELAGTGIIGGATASRSFELDPYFIRFPSMSLRGTATTPSQVEIYVNGVLVDRREVPPGPFEIGNVPAASGTATATVVLRDAFGREQTQSSSFYYSTGVLGRGLSEYTYSAGMVRALSGSFDYDEPIIFAAHRYGVTDHFTIGGRLEATGSIVSGGPSVALASPLGEIDLKIAGSSAEGRLGAAGQLAVRRLSRRTNIGGTVRLRSREYVNFSLPVERDRPLEDATLYAAYLPTWGNIGLQWNSVRMRDSGDRHRLSVLSNVALGSRANLLLSAAAIEERGDRFHEYFLGISLHAFRASTVNLSTYSRDGVNSVSAEIQRPMPVGTGWGYRLQSATGPDDTSGHASVQYQNDFGRYEVGIDPEHPGQATLSAAGAVVYQSGKIAPTRPVALSFALIRVPGVEGVRVYLSNQLVGRTDDRGDLLVPNLLPYYGNRIRIDDRDVPMTHDIQVIEKTIAPPPRGGALVIFPAREVRAAVGTVVVATAAGEIIPAYGELRMKTPDAINASPIGGAGEFYFENVTPGTYEAEVVYDGGSCTFSLQVPKASADVIGIGRVVCAGAAR